MKKYLLFFLLLLPCTALMAQDYVDEPNEPDSLSVEYNEQEIKDLNSGKAVVEESSVMEMLDLVSNIRIKELVSGSSLPLLEELIKESLRTPGSGSGEETVRSQASSAAAANGSN